MFDEDRRGDPDKDVAGRHSFDELARGLADGTISRHRAALRLVAGALLVGGGLPTLLPTSSEAV